MLTVHPLAKQKLDWLMDSNSEPFLGTWHILEMAVWSSESINLIGQARLTFEDDGMGSFQFIAVKGFMDCRYSWNNELPHVEFSWQGYDERDDALGRGWATIEKDGTMNGHIFIHCGEDSSFRATLA